MLNNQLFMLINGAWAVLALWTVCVFLAFVWQERKRPYSDHVLGAAISIVVAQIGEAGARGYTWYLRWKISQGLDSPDSYQENTVILVFGGIAAIGLLCMIRNFTITSGPWIFAAISAVLFTLTFTEGLLTRDQLIFILAATAIGIASMAIFQAWDLVRGRIMPWWRKQPEVKTKKKR
jgi:hypothetical protein